MASRTSVRHGFLVPGHSTAGGHCHALLPERSARLHSGSLKGALSLATIPTPGSRKAAWNAPQEMPAMGATHLGLRLPLRGDEESTVGEYRRPRHSCTTPEREDTFLRTLS